MSVVSVITPEPVPPKSLHLKAGEHGILLLHGLSSSPLELQFLARGLHRAGYTVRVPVIEGYSHGCKSGSPRSTQDWLASAQHEFNNLSAQCKTVSVGGLCVGAVIALHLAAQPALQVASVLSLSVSLHNDGWATPWYSALLKWAPYVPWAGRIAIKETHPFGLKDERMRTWVARQMQVAGQSDAGACTLLVADLVKAQQLSRQLKRRLDRIACPTLLIHAKEDECARPRSSFEVACGISSSQVRCVLLHNSYHMISMDQEKTLVLTEMVQFLASHVTQASHLDRPASAPQAADAAVQAQAS